jgi:hypothetical protein
VLVWALTSFCGNEDGEPSHHLLIYSPPMATLLPKHPEMSQFVHNVASFLYFHLLQQLGRVEHELEGPYEGSKGSNNVREEMSILKIGMHSKRRGGGA